MMFAYRAWIAIELVLVLAGRKKLEAFGAFARVWRK